MKTHYFYKALRRTTIQFLDLFNDIRIARYNEDGYVEGYITVPLKFMPKEKIYLWMTSRWLHGEIILPMMGISLAALTYASDRQVNKLEKVLISQSKDTSQLSNYINPIPYNMEFQVNIYALNMVDLDQVLEQILPFFSPYIMMRIYIPELESYFEVKVIFESCSPDASVDIPEEDYRILKWDLAFSVQTYLFQPKKTYPLIENVINRYYLNEKQWKGRSNTTTSTTTSADGSINVVTTLTDYVPSGGQNFTKYRKNEDGTFTEDTTGLYMATNADKTDFARFYWIQDAHGNYEIVLTKDTIGSTNEDNSTYKINGLEYDDDGKMLIDVEYYGEQ